MNGHNICARTVADGLCIGCGVCAGICPTGNLVMAWNSTGLWEPREHGRCLAKCDLCVRACPFLDHEEDESTLSKTHFAQVNGIQYKPEVGYYLQCYVGHAASGYRERGASGGLASWFLGALLAERVVDQVVCVRANGSPDRLFNYTICKSMEELRSGAGSAYYPVELSQVIKAILQGEGKSAIIGVPCFLKSLRLAAGSSSHLRERLTVLCGLVCGQTKVRGFADYLARSAGGPLEGGETVSFRNKNLQKSSSNFSFSVATNRVSRKLPFSGLYGEAWVRGEFTPTPCRVCDDVFAEVAEVAFMDAWLPQYLGDSRGTSIALLRSPRAQNIFEAGIVRRELHVSPIPVERVIASQAGVLKQKRLLLQYRLGMTRDSRLLRRKRVNPLAAPWMIKRHLVAREHVRNRSLEVVAAMGRNFDSGRYDSKMRLARAHLRCITLVQTLWSRLRNLIPVTLRMRRSCGVSAGDRQLV